jgi:cytoskeletal protein RodZ
MEKGWSVQEVSKKTKIRVKYIEAMEKGEWKAFPGPVYIAGFVKSYAEALDLNSEKLMILFKREYVAEYPDQILPDGLTQDVVKERSILLTIKNLINTIIS